MKKHQKQMKIAILSDIHGNNAALSEVLRSIDRQGLSNLFVLGDQLGYYFQAEKVYKELSRYVNCMIQGNHERLFLEFLKADEARRKELTEKYGSCFSFYEKTFTPDLIDFIRKLPKSMSVERDGLRFSLCHGAPVDEDQYLYPDAEAEIFQQFDMPGTDFVFFGHTHYPMMYCGKHSVLINPGSVGQARTVGGVANWGILDTKNGVYTPQCTPYNIQTVIEDLAKKKNTKSYLQEVLKRNNAWHEV